MCTCYDEDLKSVALLGKIPPNIITFFNIFDIINNRIHFLSEEI